MDGREAMASYYLQRGIGGLRNPQPNVRGSSSVGSSFPLECPPMAAIPPHAVGGPPPAAALPLSGEPLIRKRKRGRPRKYGSDAAMSLALSSTPPSASAGGPARLGSDSGICSTVPQKRPRGRPPGSGRKQQLASLGKMFSDSAGMGFTPHVITIPVGEDIATKIMSFSQQGPRAVCILSANGAVSMVTLRQPSSFGGTITYEGRFEILCMSGSYLLTDDGGTCSRAGGLSVSLSSSDGRVIGGGVGGILIAATPVQVIVGSFIYGGAKGTNKSGVSLESPMDFNGSLPPTSLPPAQSSIPNAVGGWLGSRPMDMRHVQMDIDLTRG